MESREDLMELTEVARRYQIRESQLRNWIKAGKLRKYQRLADKRVFVNPHDVVELYRIRPVDGDDDADSPQP